MTVQLTKNKDGLRLFAEAVMPCVFQVLLVQIIKLYVVVADLILWLPVSTLFEDNIDKNCPDLLL